MRRLIRKIKDAYRVRFPNLNYSSYVKDYLFTANVRSSIYVGIVVSLLEIWMLITVITGTITSDGKQDFLWIFKHTISYIALLFAAVIMLIYSIYYLKGKVKNKKLGLATQFFFMLVAIPFGLYISYASYDPTGKVFVFITMEAFCLCLFVWHPVNHTIILTSTFILFLILANVKTPVSYSLKVNSFTLWVVFLMIGINAHHQRRIEAQKDENLEKLTKYLKKKSLEDELTKLPNMNSFQRKALEMLSDEKMELSSLRFVFMDIENFKSYNEKYGFQEGNNFLRTISHIMQATFEGDFVAHFSDDHFIALTKADGLEEKLVFLKKQIKELETSIQIGLKSGIYMPTDRLVTPSVAIDYARYACASIKKHFTKDIAEYSTELATDFKRKQYIINNIGTALKEGYIKVFYQPVVWAENRVVCGSEALARWDDPTYGFISPAIFIPVLEEYHLIHELDMYVVERVCKDLYDAYVNHEPCIPISINFSRLDFDLVNPVEELTSRMEKYGIRKEDIHVEITESALTSNNLKLKKDMNDFRAKGFSLWLDDFGSGYSGLNVLKDYSFDMMKIDMKFLSEFSENEKTQPILESIVNLAKTIGMQTLTEGVETEEAYNFLRSIGCQRLQGYLFGKPMTRQEYIRRINEGELKIDESFLTKN